MRFTWWTYWVALRRARKNEIFWRSQHEAAFCGPEHWYLAIVQTELLYIRRYRKILQLMKRIGW